MSILNFYQLALVSTIVGTIVLANWARKQKAFPVAQSSTLPPSKFPKEAVVQTTPQNLIPELKKLTTPITDSVKERIQALDKLFDENVISVDEYVELRKRALG